MDKQIRENKKAHDKIARKYESRHPEIYNEVEQTRLHNSLKRAIKEIKTDSKRKIALDFGCGAGNLTKHLMELDLGVVSADISPKFLEMIEDRFPEIHKSKTLKLNGEDLSNIEDEKFDLIATYSVLHHVPDYLKIVKEFVRVIKPGGVIYIDHEVNNNYWEPSKELKEFREKVGTSKKSIFRFLNPDTYLQKIKTTINPKYQAEGDIHVWQDDHIEWEKIKKVFQENGCELVKEEDFLSFNDAYKKDIWADYKDKISDMKYLIVRKP
jgi:ubiquinone/menaquinone biosynthesis C-methylase UbiE